MPLVPDVSHQQRVVEGDRALGKTRAVTEEAGLHAPDVTFARFDYAFDETQAFFGSLAGVPADELVTLIDQSEADIEAAGVPLATYVAPGDDHTIIGQDEFYELEVEGVRLVDWFAALVAGDVPPDVHCTECG